MTIEETLDLVAPDTPVTICEAGGRMHYVGNVHGAHKFDTWELGQICASGSCVVLIISINDMLD